MNEVLGAACVATKLKEGQQGWANGEAEERRRLTYSEVCARATAVQESHDMKGGGMEGGEEPIGNLKRCRGQTTY